MEDSEFNFKDVERELFAASDDIPRWSTATRAREMLCRVLMEISGGKIEYPVAGGDLSGLEADESRQMATMNLGVIAIRASATAQSHIACGYVLEAKASIRRLVETVTRARAIADDESGAHARAWLSGRPLSSVARLRRRFSAPAVADSFSGAVHADIDVLHFLLRGSGANMTMLFGPRRDEEDEKLADALLGIMAGELLEMKVAFLTVFRPALFFATWLDILALQEEMGLHGFPVRPAWMGPCDGNGGDAS